MKNKFSLIPAAALCFLLTASPALAYVGPGAGVSLIGAIIGVVMAVGTVFAFFMMLPFRALLRKKKPVDQGVGATTEPEHSKVNS